MKALMPLRGQLGFRLFVSYLVVIGVATTVLVGIAQLHAPFALAPGDKRLLEFSGGDSAVAEAIAQGYADATSEVVVVAVLAATVAAVAVSVFTARRIVAPIGAMERASRNIAAGDYRQRVEVRGNDELGALAVAFNRMAEVLEGTERRRQELIGDVAHELRTPLAGIRSTMEGMVDGVVAADLETFRGVEREVGRLQRLVHDLEELSRLEGGQALLDLRPQSPQELIETAVRRLEPQYADKGLALAVELPAELPAVCADSGRVVQVLINLLGNALQYTPAGGRVTCSAAPHDGMLAITVSDTGIGIAPEQLPHIFERFYRADRSRARAGGGSGIGLTIAQQLVAAHGGRIWATSPGAGRGSAFTFTLPLAIRPGDLSSNLHNSDTLSPRSGATLCS